MKKQNLHTHTDLSDGRDSMEAMTLSAIETGINSLGFSEHSYDPYYPPRLLKKDYYPAYFAEYNRIKQKYSGQIELFLGFESDSYFPVEKDGLDYTIGSKHYVLNEKTGEHLTIDYMSDTFEKAVNDIAGGSIEKLLHLYYEDLTRFLAEHKPDIAGHLDIICKLNIGNRYFNPDSTWYKELVEETAEKVARIGCIVEVNTGGMFRNKMPHPYPSPYFLSRLLSYNVPATVTSDSHSADSLDYWFDEALELLKKTGYRSVKQLTADGFIDVEI